MEIRQKFASAIRAYKIMRGYTSAECAAALDVSLTAFKQYAAGKGNPNLATIERVSSKMGIDSSVLLAGAFSEAQLTILKTFFDTMRLFEKLSPAKRNFLLTLLFLILSLFADGEWGENND